MKKEAVLILILAFMLDAASASFILGNSSIQTDYSPGDKISGILNISFQSEPSDSRVESNFEGGMSLKSFLENNSASYICSPADCENEYESSNAENEKKLSMNYGDEKVISFRIDGNINSIDSISFDISAGNSPSCVNPLEIDFLDDSSINWKSKIYGDDYSCRYESGTGCFDSLSSLTDAKILSTPYCEKIFLTESGKFYIGAWVSGTGGTLSMEVFNSENNKVAGCNLPAISGAGEYGCAVSYDNSRIKEHYVCIKGSGNYTTKMELNNDNSCGFLAVPGQQTEYHDYYIFARGAKFESIGNIKFNQQEYAKSNSVELKTEVFNYIKERYLRNCTSGCNIPVRFKAFGNFDIDISGLNLIYTTGASQFTANKIYDASVKKAKISSGSLSLDVEKSGIKVPESYGNKSLVIYLGTQEVLRKEITIAQVPKINKILPTVTLAGALTKFTVNITSAGNSSIVKYSWDFGDETTEITEENFVEHVYSETGSYNLELEVQDSKGMTAKKKVVIIAGNPVEIVNSSLRKLRERINNLTREIENEPGWYKEKLKEEIGLEEADSELLSLEREFATADEEDYSSIMERISEMRIPSRIERTNQISFPLIVDGESIQLEKLEELGAGSYDEENGENIRGAITLWNDRNIEASADFYEISGVYDDKIENILSYVKLKIKAKEEIGESYLVINGNVNVNLGDTKEFDDAVGISLENLDETEIEFTAPKLNPYDVSVYVSPEFSMLEFPDLNCNYDDVCDKESGENWKNCRNDCKPIGRAIFYFFLLVFTAFITYIILEEWYKRRYEAHLFKNRNDLYNIVNFANNGINQGIDRGEIARRLKQAGWHSEQISYAMKKVKGKKTGMPLEFSFKFGKNKKIK